MHFKLYADERRKCGAWDCFEAYASGTGLKTLAEEMLNDKNVTTYDVIEGVKNGDEKNGKSFFKMAKRPSCRTCRTCKPF